MKWLIFYFLPITLFATTIPIKNNSQYPLIATIISADNVVVSSSRIDPGHTHTWSDSVQALANWEKGPFRVVFFCLNDTFYGEVYPVNDKLQVYARNALRGEKRCTP